MSNLVINATAGATPTTNDLSVDEVGVNTADGKIFFNNGEVIITLPIMQVITALSALTSTAVNGETEKAISSDWAFDHTANSQAHPRDTRSQLAGIYNKTIGTDTDVNTSGAQVIDVLTLTDGVVVGHTKRTLTVGDIGALASGGTAVNASKLNNQLPAYYGKQTDIDALNAIVFSDDEALNEIQEIVNYIKLNRTDLDALSIASIAGLVAALAGKSDTNHGHTLASLGFTGASNANYFTYSLPSSVVHETEKGALHSSDALRISGHRVYLYKGDGTHEYVDIPDNNTDTNTWRGVDDTPVNGQTAESISSNWAFDHNANSQAHPRDARNQVAGSYAASIHSHSGYVNQASKGVSGYWKCKTTGVIIQWGVGSIASGNTTSAHTFPIAFPSNCQSVSITVSQTGTVDLHPVYVYSSGASSFTARNTQGNAKTYNWMAIGY